MNKKKGYAALCLAAALALTLAGCGESAAPSAAPVPPVDTPKTSSSAPAATPSATPSPAAEVIVLDTDVDWESTAHEDEYLSYEVPAGWEEKPDSSNAAQRFTFFWPRQTSTEFPSNVNIQITSLEPAEQFIDYGDPEIQEEFHQFLLTNGGLPAEAKDGVFTVYQGPDCYFYALTFDRKAEDGTPVTQTCYAVVGLDYSAVIWATDFGDGVSPTADETALHMCATLAIK